jgi:hypothetical protein
MFHCHNAVHSDQGMMSVFNVTKLVDLGYKGLDTMLEDPMDTRFRAKPYTATDISEIKSKLLPFFAGLNAYPDPAALSEVEDRYWSTRTPPSGDVTGPAVKGGGMMSGMMGGAMGGDMASHHGGQSANTPKPSNMGSMSGDMASHHGGQPASVPKSSNMASMGGDMSSHHGGMSSSAPTPSTSSSASHAGMSSGMNMGSGNMASHHGGGGMMGMRRT